MTVVSVSELTGPILVTDAKPGLDSIMWIIKFNASATACITIASAHDPGVKYKLCITISFTEHQLDYEYSCDG